MNRNYVNGRALEYQTVHWFESLGAIWAGRTAGSHGPMDVIGFFPWGVAAAQCKRSDGSGPTKKEWADFNAFAKSCPIPCCMVFKGRKAPVQRMWSSVSEELYRALEMENIKGEGK